ncbi:hypothetical protein IMSAGC022_01083 [Alistipes sp.]|nr:hypothetical protein IMSAGC022_01083 [Alistipes sp.]
MSANRKNALNYETYHSSVGSVGRLRTTPTRYRDDRPQRGRVGTHRRDGRRVRTEHIVRIPGHEAHTPGNVQGARRTSYDYRPRALHGALRRGGRRHRDLPLRSDDGHTRLHSLPTRGRRQGGHLDQAGHLARGAARHTPVGGSGACNERRAGLRRAVVHAGGRRQGAHAR